MPYFVFLKKAGIVKKTCPAKLEFKSKLKSKLERKEDSVMKGIYGCRYSRERKAYCLKTRKLAILFTAECYYWNVVEFSLLK